MDLNNPVRNILILVIKENLTLYIVSLFVVLIYFYLLRKVKKGRRRKR
jgi:hypothetical protein